MTGENLTDHPLAVAWGGTVVSHVIGKCYFFLGAAFPPVLTLSAVSRCLEGYPFDVARVAGWLLFLTQTEKMTKSEDSATEPARKVRAPSFVVSLADLRAFGGKCAACVVV